MRLLLAWPARLIVAVLGAGAGCALAQRPATVGPKPEPALTLSPRISFIGPTSSGVVVRAILRVSNPTTDHRCAAQLWEWGDGEHSSHAEDCRPEDLEPWLSDAPYVLTKEHIYRAPGVYDVSVMLVAARGPLMRSEARLQIVRPGEGGIE